MVKLLPVPPDAVPQVWQILEPEIKSIADRSHGRLTVESIREEVSVPIQGGYRKFAWVAVDENGALMAIAIGGIEEFPGSKMLRIYGLSGRDRQKWLPLRTEIEAWAVSQGCTKAVFLARKGYARDLPDYRLEHVELVKDLRP